MVTPNVTEVSPQRLPTVIPDLSERRRIHVVGVGGPGMSAVAIALAGMGHDVSGSDIRERQVLERLRAAGVRVHIGHDRRHVHDCDVVTASTAIPVDLNELDEARKRGISVTSRAGILAAICARTGALAVAGTHGKTTTSSMLMLMLAAGDLRPGFIIGGDVADVGTGAQWTGSDWFVVEADESDGTHSHLPLVGTVLTNIDRDHLDHFGSFAALVESFSEYLDRVEGPRVVCLDDPVAGPLARRPDCVSYGLDPEARYRVVDVVAADGRQDFAVEHPGGRTEVRLPLRGIHNAVNATGAFALAVEIGVDPDVAARALGAFGGVARRFDIRAVDNGATFVDDYAHLPAEIAAVLAAARHSGDGWKRVIAVFQPNRFNRMSEIWRDYAHCFAEADLVVLTDIYASGTTPIPGVTGKLVVNAVTEADPTRRVVWMRQREDLVRFLASEVGEGDVCISMGCGDIASLPDEIVEARVRSGRGSAA